MRRHGIYVSNLYTYPPPCYSNSRNYYLSMPRQGETYLFGARIIAFSGAFLWSNYPWRSYLVILSSFKRKLCARLEAVISDGLWQKTARVVIFIASRSFHINNNYTLRLPLAFFTVTTSPLQADCIPKEEASLHYFKNNIFHFVC